MPEYTPPSPHNTALWRSSMPDGVKVVWKALRYRQGSNASAWPYLSTLAGDVGKSDSVTSRALSVLVATGWVEVVEEGRPVQYRCTVGTTDEDAIKQAVAGSRGRSSRSGKSAKVKAPNLRPAQVEEEVTESDNLRPAQANGTKTLAPNLRPAQVQLATRASLTCDPRKLPHTPYKEELKQEGKQENKQGSTVDAQRAAQTLEAGDGQKQSSGGNGRSGGQSASRDSGTSIPSPKTGPEAEPEFAWLADRAVPVTADEEEHAGEVERILGIADRVTGSNLHSPTAVEVFYRHTFGYRVDGRDGKVRTRGFMGGEWRVAKDLVEAGYPADWLAYAFVVASRKGASMANVPRFIDQWITRLAEADAAGSTRSVNRRLVGRNGDPVGRSGIPRAAPPGQVDLPGMSRGEAIQSLALRQWPPGEDPLNPPGTGFEPLPDSEITSILSRFYAVHPDHPDRWTPKRKLAA